MFFKRWNKNGDVANCEESQLEEMKKNGYDFKECPDQDKKKRKKSSKRKKEVDLDIEPETKKEEIYLDVDPETEKEVEPEVGIIL